MPLPTPQRTDPIFQNAWTRGIITSIPPEEIPNDAAQDLLNVEFDSDSNLVTRNGTTLFLDTNETGRITSIFRAEYSDGTVWILFTTGTKLYRCTESGGSLTDITGALTFPSNTIWQWVMFGDFAIGVNQATSGTNPVKVNAAGTASLLANAPFSKYCEVWNNRLWLVRAAATERNSVFASAINLPEDWTVDDDAGAIQILVDPNDGDYITAIKVFRGSLYVYKRKKINVISPISAPATIPSNLRVDVYTTNVGCVSPYTVQNVLDDQVFLADSGVMSLTLAPLGELSGSLLSDNIAQLAILKKVSAIKDVVSYVLDDVQQYLVSFPASVTDSGAPEVWILDYQKITEKDEKGFPIVRWVRMSGKVAGTAYSERLDQNYKTYLIAEHDPPSGDTFIYNYQPANPVKVFNDNSAAYLQRILTKSYSAQSPLLRRLWHRFGVAFRLISDVLNLNIRWYFNNSPSPAGNYPIQFTFSGVGLSLYGQAIYGTDTYDSLLSAQQEEVVWRQFKKSSSGRKARNVAMEFITESEDEGFVLKFVQLEYLQLNQRRARTR